MEQGPDQDQAISRAFVLIPWRKEAQVLFERRAWRLRDSNDMGGFRQYVRDFVSRSEVKQAVANVSSRRDLPFYLDKTTDSAFNDPVIWYASILPEGEEEKQHPLKEFAISVLSARDADSDAEAKILRTYLRLALNDKGEEGERINELRRLLTQYASYKNAAATQTYQMGCDILACYYIKNCRPNEATYWFGKELEARDRQQSAGNVLWQRPPEKLKLYQMFLLKMKATGENVKEARKLS